ncbi:hypothetical protein P879_07776 [Paragonimus westermani]|uniref:P-type ATPase A domain-containing protein n=1 Tax=Paragonimus westermani TaxID=34504 RepID=A0A8T0D1W3_9TREM|nr:hypothetical protein P879_07776 [Paragonimus westermani]
MISIIDSHSGVVLDTYSAYKFKRLYPDVSRGQIKESHRMVYFFYKRLKYIWDEDQNQFCVLSEFGEQPYAKLFPVRPLPETVVSTRRAFYEANEIAIHLTPITKVLLSECLNPFYCFQAFSCTLWFIEDYWMYASCILVMSAISLCTQVYETRRNEVALKKTICGSAILTVCREVNGTVEFQDVDSTELVPGDLIEIPRKGCMMHCDAFVLTGNCIVNESTLTGESVPVTKTPLPDRQRRDDAFNIRSLARHVLFDGTSVIQTRNYANERVMAVVVRTGFRTAKGELVRSILYPKPMKFKFAQDALKFVAALGGLSVLGFAVSVFLMHRSGVETGRIVLRALDLITIVVPPALPVAMTVAIVFAQRRLRGHNIYCINPSAINVCGVINVACFDKTGTLTEDGMDLWGVVPNNQGNFGEPQMNPSEFEHGPLLEAMASCHSLTRIEGVLSGDPLDLKMFQSTKWEFLEEVSEDHCKFEMAVPAIVRPEIKGSLTNVTLDSTIEPDMIPYEIGILRQFPFTSSLQRMSVIARVLNSSHFSVYTKGAPEMLETLCRRDTLPSDYQSVLLEYTREGYRVLALAWRPLKVSYTKVLRIPRERAEQDLLFLGFLVMENRLKPETAPAIQVLRNANIRPVMVTGDNMLTAVSVARDCEIIDELDRIIIVSAKPPPKSNSADVAFNGVSDAAGDVMNPVDPTGFAQQQQQHAPFLISLGQLDRIWPTGSSEPYGFTVTRDHPLVEFHYAEDLHKPVTEVTVTSDGVNGWRNQRVRRRRSDGLFSSHGHGKSLFSRWTNCFRKPSDSQPSYGAVPTTALTGSAGVAGSTVTPEIGGAQTYGESAPPWRASGTNHRVTIRMIDRPDFHLAISGKTWGVIKEHYPWLIPKVSLMSSQTLWLLSNRRSLLVG